MMRIAAKFQREGLLDLAFDTYHQCVTVFIQLSGPVQEEAVECLQRMAQISVAQGDLQLGIDF